MIRAAPSMAWGVGISEKKTRPIRIAQISPVYSTATRRLPSPRAKASASATWPARPSAPIRMKAGQSADVIGAQNNAAGKARIAAGIAYWNSAIVKGGSPRFARWRSSTMESA